MNLKLNYKNTLLLGLTFFGILMLWQVYNTYCPIILEYLLKEKFGADKDYYYVSGVLMALDNVAALFLMPFVGNLSDKTKSKYGKRMPYVIIGTLISLLIFPLIALFFVFKSLSGVIIAMLLILVFMQAYRSPAVSLMPDVTPKPLRSKANGLVNLVGYFGAISAALLGMIFVVKNDTSIESAAQIALYPFIITSVVMIVILIIISLKFKENKILKEVEEDLKIGEELSQTVEKIEEDKPLAKGDKRNLIFLIVSIFLWYMSFNAVETFNSLFSTKILDSSGVHSTFTIVLTISSVLSFAFLSSLSNKIGRKKTVLIGLGLLISGFLIVSIYTYTLAPSYQIVIYGSTLLLGCGWALVNINSYPMLVEMASQKNIGKFTGIYYGATMLAQSITPILVGLIMSFSSRGLKALYVYAFVFMLLAFIFFMFIKEHKKLVK